MYYPSTHNNQTYISTKLHTHAYISKHSMHSNNAPYCHTYERVLF